MARRKLGRAALPRMLSPLPGGIQARALARIGSGDVEALSRLLDFVNRPPESFATVSDRELRNLQNEVAVFCEPLGSIEGGVRGILTKEMVGDLAREILAKLTNLLDGASFDLQIPSVTLLVIPNSKCIYIGTPDAMFRLAVARLLENEGHRIRRCARPGCGRLFVRRKRGLYCGKQCSQLVHFRRYLERHASS